MLTEGCTAIFVDVSPTVNDEEKLKTCGLVIVLDHHHSVAATLEALKTSVDQLEDFSDTGGLACGVTLAIKFTDSRMIPDWIVELFHNNDVHEHILSDAVQSHRDAFYGFITQYGLARCTTALVQQFLDQPADALVQGAKLYEPVEARTRHVFEQRKHIEDTPAVSVWAVDLGRNPSKVFMDDQLYQGLIDSLASDKATVFVTLVRIPLASGLWTIGLRRAGKHVDVGLVSNWLGECVNLGFKTGGGHPYAAGAQCEDLDLSVEMICNMIALICTERQVQC